MPLRTMRALRALAFCVCAACGGEPAADGEFPGDAGGASSAVDAGGSAGDGGAAPGAGADASGEADADGPVEADAGGETDAGAAGDATLIYVGDFEDPGDFEPGGTYPQFSDNVDTCEHDETCETDSLAIVDTPVRGGSRAARFTLRDGDTQDTSGTRAELQTRSHYETTLEEDYWYGFSIYVPADWEDGSDQKVVHQWHTASGQPGGSPIIGLRIKEGRWRITREFVEEDAITLWQGGPVAKGAWTDWVMHVRWSPTANGHFTAWMDGAEVYGEDGPNMNAGTTAGGHYQKFGMYGSFGDSVVRERVLYYDEIRVAKGSGGYDLVAP